ncbi:MAG: GNAT family N-acetyltransferase [Anaerolineales bacterium]|jgi:GNAT superfamily N-acetyltransferase
MQTILSDFSFQTLVRAIKANWADYYFYLGRSPSVEMFVGPYLTWVLTGIPDSFLNVVLRTQLPSDRAGEIIGETLAHFRSRNVKRLSWWAETDTPRTDLDKHLLSHSLTFNEGGTGMATDLVALHEDLSTPAGLAIMPVEDKATLKQWIHVASIGFGIPEHGERRWFDLFADLGFEMPMRYYLAVMNGEPVGTSQFFLSAGVAGIYNVTCLPEARGQGIGAAITLAPLLEARRMGYRISILQASHLGYKVYLRLGFQEYGKLNYYLWENETKPPDAAGNGA